MELTFETSSVSGGARDKDLKPTRTLHVVSVRPNHFRSAKVGSQTNATKKNLRVKQYLHPELVPERR